MPEPGSIEVYDGLVSTELMTALFDVVHQPVYLFGQKSNPDDPFGFWIAKVPDTLLSGDNPIAALWQLIERDVTRGRFDIERVYVNAYTYGDCPTIHVDHDADGHFTALYYVNLEWRAEWSGETVFYNQARDEIIRSVLPRPGRLAVFDGTVPHVAREPNRIAPVVRYTLALKLRLKSS